LARAARTFAQVDVHYLEDDRILDAGDAWQLHFAAILACKRNLSDGTITRRQLVRVAPESVPDVAPMIDTLIRVGLFIDRGNLIEIEGWSNWNNSADEVETMSKGGVKGNHLRHHVNRSVWGKSCAICKEQKTRGLSLPESPTDRPPSRREDVDTDEDLDPDVRRGDVDSGSRLSICDKRIVDDASAELESDEALDQGQIDSIHRKKIRFESAFGKVPV
jgi:hypothetical protein